MSNTVGTTVLPSGNRKDTAQVKFVRPLGAPGGLGFCVNRSKGTLLLLWLLLTLPMAARAQFTYTSAKGAATITGYSGPGGQVSIPDTLGGLPVRTLGELAFYGKASLTDVTIPSGVTSIGNSCFSGCVNLKSISLPSTLNMVGDRAFLGCSRLAEVTLPGSVTVI